jgi:multidrug resistance efflux pump
MIVAIFNVYLVILFLLVHFKIVRFNLFWKCSPAIVLIMLTVGLFIPMGWGAPAGQALVVRNSVGIVPNVGGEVIDVPVEANKPLKAGDVLFRIDPAPYQFKVRELEAELVAAQRKAEQLKTEVDATKADVATLTSQLGFATQRRDDIAKLEKNNTASEFRLQDEQKQVDSLTGQLAAAKAHETSAELALSAEIDGVNTEVARVTAELDDARWNLDQTTVRAPSDGYVTNLALRKGARVSKLPLSPVMAFIDVSDTLVGVEIAQINARYVAPGQKVEATFKFLPGSILTGKVTEVLQAISTGQVQTSGLAATPHALQSAPFVARIKLDDGEVARTLPAGAVGSAAIFTEHVKPSHIIRRVLLRQTAILNYVVPF